MEKVKTYNRCTYFYIPVLYKNSLFKNSDVQVKKALFMFEDLFGLERFENETLVGKY